jgi:polyisoprenoid-binding protein YceI
MSIPDNLPDDRFGETISGSWRLDPQRSSVKFRVGHFWGLMTVKGHFDDYHGQLELSASPTIELTINAASLQTGNRKRDEHLRSTDFFYAEKHPLVQFVSDSVDPQGDTLQVRGRLSARGRSIPVKLDAHIRQLGRELEIEAATTVLHGELGMTWSPLRMIRPRSELLVKAYLARAQSPGDSPAGPARGPTINIEGMAARVLAADSEPCVFAVVRGRRDRCGGGSWKGRRR